MPAKDMNRFELSHRASVTNITGNFNSSSGSPARVWQPVSADGSVVRHQLINTKRALLLPILGQNSTEVLEVRAAGPSSFEPFGLAVPDGVGTQLVSSFAALPYNGSSSIILSFIRLRRRSRFSRSSFVILPSSSQFTLRFSRLFRLVSSLSLSLSLPLWL